MTARTPAGASFPDVGEITDAAPGNRAPLFTTAPPAFAAEGEPWSYAAAAVDPDGHDVAFSLSVAPVGMTLDTATGQLRWTPAASDLGQHDVGWWHRTPAAGERCSASP